MQGKSPFPRNTYVCRAQSDTTQGEPSPDVSRLVGGGLSQSKGSLTVYLPHKQLQDKDLQSICHYLLHDQVCRNPVSDYYCYHYYCRTRCRIITAIILTMIYVHTSIIFFVTVDAVNVLCPAHLFSSSCGQHSQRRRTRF